MVWGVEESGVIGDDFEYVKVWRCSEIGSGCNDVKLIFALR